MLKDAQLPSESLMSGEMSNLNNSQLSDNMTKASSCLQSNIKKCCPDDYSTNNEKILEMHTT